MNILPANFVFVHGLGGQKEHYRSAFHTRYGLGKGVLSLDLMGFAAGAMIFLVLVEMIPDALATARPAAIAWAFMLGFCAMLLLQVAL